MRGRKRKINAEDATNLLDSALLREIFQYVGDESYRGVAGTCRRFGKIYRKVYATRKTLAEEMVRTVSGAKLFLHETNERSRFRIEKNGQVIVVPSPTYSPLEFVHFSAALNGRLDLLKWSVAQGFPLQYDRDTWAFSAYGGNFEALQRARANGCF